MSNIEPKRVNHKTAEAVRAMLFLRNLGMPEPAAIKSHPFYLAMKPGPRTKKGKKK